MMPHALGRTPSSAVAAPSPLPLVVISAVNLVEGGTFSILQDCLTAALAHWGPRVRLKVLVHALDERLPVGPEYIACPQAKRAYWRRLYHEWFLFGQWSRQWRPTLWFSLHDITPRVPGAQRQAVYCHNPMPFYRMRAWEIRLHPKNWLFQLGYMALYRCFIGRNAWVVVQQHWMRVTMQARLGLARVVVARPHGANTAPNGAILNGGVGDGAVSNSAVTNATAPQGAGPVAFFYPAWPRTFKNMEVLCAAAERLSARGYVFEVWLTLQPDDDVYARRLHQRFAHVACIQWLGRLTRTQVQARYQASTALVFPSRLETWGLPLSEYQHTGKPMVVADAPYAQESLGHYPWVSYFPPDDVDALEQQLQALLERRWQPQARPWQPPPAPYAPDWPALLDLLLPEGAHV